MAYGVTQVRHLRNATQQVRDFLDTEDPKTDHSQWDVALHLDMDDLGPRVVASREATAAAAKAQREAAEQVRSVVRQLRKQGVSVTDCAALLGVSRGRISQLAG